MRILLTGSSGQIGTNLALRLQADGHWVFGVDKRSNTWTRRVRDAAPGSRGQYPAFQGGIAASSTREVDLVVHMAAHAKVHQLVRQPHRALENAIMTFNVLEYCRQLELPLVFSSTREVYGDVHRFEEYGEAAADFAFTESPYSASKITSEAFIYSYARCYGARYLVFRFSNVYGRYDSDLQRMERVLPLFIHQMQPRRADHGLRRRREGARLHLHRRLRRRDRARDRAARRRPGGERDDQPRVRPGQHARARRRADRRRARRRAADHARAVARRRGDALRRRHPQGPRPARLGAADAARPRASRARSHGSASGAPRTPRRIDRSPRERRRTGSSTASSRPPAPARRAGPLVPSSPSRHASNADVSRACPSDRPPARHAPQLPPGRAGRSTALEADDTDARALGLRDLRSKCGHGSSTRCPTARR